MNSFGLKPSSFYHRGVLLGWYVTCATFLMTEQNYKRFFDLRFFFKIFFGEQQKVDDYNQPVGFRYDPASPLLNYIQPVEEIEF
jgi:hypothetical protein